MRFRAILLASASRRGGRILTPAEIWGDLGDSRVPGVLLASRGTLDLTALPAGCKQVKQDGTLSSTLPLDYLTQTQDFLGCMETFIVDRHTATGANVYHIPCAIAGNKASDVVDQLPGIISRVNAAIAMIRATDPGAVFRGFFGTLGTNDDSPTDQFGPRIAQIDADLRAGIFKNGTSGATVGAEMSLIWFGLNPQQVDTNPTVKKPWEMAMRTQGAAGVNGFLPIPRLLDGVSMCADLLHNTNAGQRWVGSQFALMVADTVPAVVSFTDRTLYSDQRMLVPVTADKYVWPTISNPALELFWDWPLGQDWPAPMVRSAGNTDIPVGVYNGTLSCRSALGVISPKSVTITSVTPYGSQPQASFDPLWIAEQRGTYVTALGGLKSKFVSVALKGGYVNIITCLRPAGVETYGPNAVASNGLIGEANPSNDGGAFNQFYFYTPVDEVVDVYIDTNNSGSPFLSHMAMHGTTHSPVSAVASANASDTVTLSAGQIAIDAGYGIGDRTPPSGCTALTNPLPAEPAFGSYRTTTGLIGCTSTGGNAKHFASVWAPAT